MSGSEVIRRWRLRLEEASSDALMATSRRSRADLGRKLEQLAEELHQAELDAALAETREAG